MDINQLVQTVLIYALPVIFAITVHEAAHGYAARYLGDNTAWMMGRVTLNPIKHIDPIGTIAMPLLLYFATSGAFLFGYAKPVPVNFGHLRRPKRDMIWVALAGPASTLTPYLYAQIGFAMLGGWLVFARVPDVVSLMGIGLIAVCGAAGAWLTVKERRVPIEPAES